MLLSGFPSSHFTIQTAVLILISSSIDARKWIDYNEPENSRVKDLHESHDFSINVDDEAPTNGIDPKYSHRYDGKYKEMTVTVPYEFDYEPLIGESEIFYQSNHIPQPRYSEIERQSSKHQIMDDHDDEYVTIRIPKKKANTLDLRNIVQTSPVSTVVTTSHHPGPTGGTTSHHPGTTSGTTSHHPGTTGGYQPQSIQRPVLVPMRYPSPRQEYTLWDYITDIFGWDDGPDTHRYRPPYYYRPHPQAHYPPQPGQYPNQLKNIISYSNHLGQPINPNSHYKVHQTNSHQLSSIHPNQIHTGSIHHSNQIHTGSIHQSNQIHHGATHYSKPHHPVTIHHSSQIHPGTIHHTNKLLTGTIHNSNQIHPGTIHHSNQIHPVSSSHQHQLKPTILTTHQSQPSTTSVRHQLHPNSLGPPKTKKIVIRRPWPLLTDEFKSKEQIERERRDFEELRERMRDSRDNRDRSWRR